VTPLLARIRFVATMLPMFLVRKARGTSPFGPQVHTAASAWDR